jgi:hypothetical protein
MIDHLKISKITAIEAVANCHEGQDLELIGTSSLKNCGETLKHAVQSGHLNDDFCFSKIFGYNTNFFYVIEQIQNNAVCWYERGIAYVYDKDGRTFLRRIRSFVTGKNSYECSPNVTGDPYPFKCCSYGNNVLIYSSIPPTYLESLAPANCVLTSSDSCLPQPVVLNENSFLSRFDGNIEAVSFSDERLVDKITALISKFTKQLKLKTTKLTAKKAEFETLELTPSVNPQAKAGTLRYDKDSKSLMFFDGQSWRKVSLEPSDSGE